MLMANRCFYIKEMKDKIFRILFSAIVLFFCLMSNAWAEDHRLIISNFSKGVDGDRVPVDWKIVKKVGSPILKIKEENNEHLLHLISEKSSFGIKKNIYVNVKKYPYINFKWKVKELPENGDFRKKETDDQAAQVYVVFGKFNFLATIVGYTWENKAPKLTTGASPVWSKSRVIVLESGSEKLGKWVMETRNVYEDYKKLFGKTPSKANLITLYINSQHTKSRAESYFGEIYFSKSRDPESPVHDENSHEINKKKM